MNDFFFVIQGSFHATSAFLSLAFPDTHTFTNTPHDETTDVSQALTSSLFEVYLVQFVSLLFH